MEKPAARSADSEAAGKLCSICQTTIIAGEQILNCPDCSLPFHEECWEENRGCSQYGCSSAPETVKSEGATELTSSSWGGEKKCPACGKTIKGKALKCRFCGANFKTRETISKKEYRGREYEDKEYIASRNKIIALFLVSASGCLSPVALVMLGLLIFNKRMGGIEYDRLAPAMKSLSICAFGLSCFLTFLLLVFAVLD